MSGCDSSNPPGFFGSAIKPVDSNQIVEPAVPPRAAKYSPTTVLACFHRLRHSSACSRGISMTREFITAHVAQAVRQAYILRKDLYATLASLLPLLSRQAMWLAAPMR